MTKASFPDKVVLQETLAEFGYEILYPVGSGSYATCWIVRRFHNKDQLFVCKAFDLSKHPKKELLMTSFRAEVDALIHLTHTNIVHCYNYFSKGDKLYLILEYCS